MMIADLVMPELDLPGIEARISAWHAAVGEKVVRGERLVEIVAGDVAVDLPAPASGVLISRSAGVEDAVVAGQVLARIQADCTELPG